MMRPIKFNFRGHILLFDYVPLIFLAVITFALGKANDLTKTNNDQVKLMADLNRQRTAAEMRARDAEKAQIPATAGLNIIVISPDGTKQKNVSARSYADINEPL